MKTTKIIAFLIYLALFSACGKDDKRPDNRKTYLTQITSGDVVTSFSYDNEGRLIKEQKVYTSGAFPTVYIEYSLFNAQGLPLRATQYNATTAGNKAYQEAEYDSQNRITKRTTLFNDGGTLVLFRYTTFTYSDNKIVRRYYDNANVLIDWSEYIYNSSGNLTVVRHYNERGEQLSRKDYTSYDDKRSAKEFLSRFTNDRMLELGQNNPLGYTASYPATGGGSFDVNYTVTYEYNQEGYVTKSTTTEGATGTSYSDNYTYEKR